MVENNFCTVHPTDKVIALYPFSDPNIPNVLELTEGTIIYVLNKNTSGWWDGVIKQPNNSMLRGWFPQNYTKPYRTGSDGYHTSRNSITSISPTASKRNSKSMLETKLSQDDEVNDEHKSNTSEHNIKEDINLLTLDAVEMLMSNLPSNSLKQTLVWSPVVQSDETTIVYYNQQLNIYCNQLPLLPTISSETSNSEHHHTATKDITSGTPLKSGILSSKAMKRDITIGDILYRNPHDIERWSEFKELAMLNLSQTHKKFLLGEKARFFEGFDNLTNHVTYIQIAYRSPDLFSKTDDKHVKSRRKLKSLLKMIASSLSVISVSSKLFFCIDGYQKLKKINDSTDGDFIKLSGSDNNLERLKDISQLREKSVTSLDSTIGPESKRSFTNYDLMFELVDIECVRLSNMIAVFFSKLIDCDTNNKSSNTEVPPILPKFIKNSFSGGAWKSPFNCVENNADFLMTQAFPLSYNSASTSTSYSNDQTLSRISSSSAISMSRRQSSWTNLMSSAVTSNLFGKRSRNANSISAIYPLTTETLQTLKSLLSQLIAKVTDLGNNQWHPIELPRTKKRNLDIISMVYEDISSNSAMLEIIENLDVSIFTNLIKLIRTPMQLGNDSETEEFLNHTSSSISCFVLEFYEYKQVLHDNFVKLILSAQQMTIEDDPYVFSSMRRNKPVGSNDPINDLCSNNRQLPDAASELMRTMILHDIETNGVTFLRASDDLKTSIIKFVESLELCCNSVEQLVEERENLLNYCARMMKNDLIVKLLQCDRTDSVTSFSAGENKTSKGQLDGQPDLSELLFKKNLDEYVIDVNSVPGSKQLNTIQTGNSVAQSEDPNDEEYQPWYLLAEHESFLLFDQKNQLKGGTEEALIERLTCHRTIDSSFNISMLITFRSMFTTLEFIHSLIARFHLAPPAGLSYDEYNEWVHYKSRPIKNSVLQILKTLFRDYWIESYYDDGLFILTNLLEVAKTQNISGTNELAEILGEKMILTTNSERNKTALSKEVSSKSGYNIISRVSTINVESNIPILGRTVSDASYTKQIKIFKPKLKLLDCDPYIYASQLTIFDQEYFMKITIHECLDRVWDSKYCNFGGSKNISNFISSANHLTNYVSFKIVITTDAKKRAKVIQFFIAVAEQCKKLNNFSSMTAIISALYSSPIHRLKKTWKLVTPKYLDTLKSLNVLMDSTKNFVNYRMLVHSIKNVPCVPFFGVYLSDLTFAQVGNSDFLKKSDKIINYSKRAKIAGIIRHIMSFKQIHYKLKPNEEIQEYIENSLIDVPQIEKQYELSLLIESKNSSNKPLASANAFKKEKRLKTKPTAEFKSSKLLKFGRKLQSSKHFA